MSNFIEEFDRNNTPDESLKDSIIDTIESALVDAPKGRTVSDEAVFTVAERAIIASASLEVDVQCFNALREVQNFLTLALEGPSANGEMSHTDLLPLGHPSSTAQHDLPASTLRTLTANWIASDPRIKSDEARSIVAAVYASNPYSVDYAFNIVRLQALAADQVPVELTLQPLVAFGNPYAGKNSSWHRRMRANRQRRDDEGQFAEMGGGIRFYARRGSSIYSIVGKVAGIPENDPNGIDIEVTGVKGFKDGIYTVPSNLTHTFKAILPEHAVSNLVPMAKNSNVPFVDIKDLKRKDLPTSWYSTKVGPAVRGLTNKVASDRSFVTGDGYQASLYNKPTDALQKRIAEAQEKFGAKIIGQFGTDQLNPDKPVYELVSSKRGQEEVVGYAQDWASTQLLATQEDRDYPDTENEPTPATTTTEQPEAQPEPALEDIPAEVYEPVDPDANMPEDWEKISDGYYQSKDGKNFVRFGTGSLGTVLNNVYDPIRDEVTPVADQVSIPDSFEVYDLNASQMLGTPTGVGFSWDDVKDIISSATTNLPVISWDPEEMENVNPPFMRFADDNALEELRNRVKDDAQYQRERLEKGGDDPDDTAESAVAAWIPTKGKSGGSGATYQAFDTHIISDPAVGELFDDMSQNPGNYTLAEATAFADIIRSTQQPNARNEKGYPQFMRKVPSEIREKLKKALAAHRPAAGNEDRLVEILANLYNYTKDQGNDPMYPVLQEVNSWPWASKNDREDNALLESLSTPKPTALDVAVQKGQRDVAPEFLTSSLVKYAPTPGKTVAVESFLRNRKLQDLIDAGDNPDENYPNFQQEFQDMTDAEVAEWLEDHKDAPYKDQYVPEAQSKYFTTLGDNGASPRQLAALERMIERRPGLISEEEAAEILAKVPNLTRREVGDQFMNDLKARELDYVQTLVNQRIANGQNYDDIELVDGVVIPEAYEPEELPTTDVFAEDLRYGDENADKIVIDGVAKGIVDILNDDGIYTVIFDDGTEKVYDNFERIPVFLPPLPEPADVEPEVEDTRENFQSEYFSIYNGTRFDVGSPLVFPIDDKTKFTLPDNIGPHVIQAVEYGLPIDNMVLPEWYGNKKAIESVIRFNSGNSKFTLDGYTPKLTLTPEEQDFSDRLVSTFNNYVGFAEQDLDRAKRSIPIQREMRKFVAKAITAVENLEKNALSDGSWVMYNEGFLRNQLLLDLGESLDSVKPLEIEGQEPTTGDQEFEDLRVAELQRAALKADLDLFRQLLNVMQSGLADALGEKVVTPQGRKLIQGAITDLSLLQPKMTLKNKNLPTPAEVNEVLARVRDGLIDAGEVHTYGKLNRPSKAMMEFLTELSSFVNETIGAYRAGSMADRPQLMAFEDNPRPQMKRFDPPAFIGPAFDGLRDVDNYQDLVDFLYSKDIYVFDFETTGLFEPIDPEIKNDPIQMAIVKISNGKIDSQMSTYINPESKVSSWVLTNVGDGQGGRVNSAFLRQQPSKKEAMQMFLDSIPEGSIIAGHNGFVFDIEVLNRTLREAGLPEFNYGGFIDTLGLARYLMPRWSQETPDAPFIINDYGTQKPAHTLEALVNYFGLSNNGRHEADSDTVSTYEVLKNMLQRGLDGKAVGGPEFNYAASTNGWNQEEYDFHAEEYEARMAEYLSKRAIDLFTTQESGDGEAEAQALLDNAVDILNGIAESQAQDRSKPQFMAFQESEPKKPTEEEQAAVLEEIDKVELDEGLFKPKPTPEGKRILQGAKAGFNLVIQAFAGSGKTTVLESIARMMKKFFPEKHGLYAVYNRQNRLEAETRMPGNVESRTFDSLSFMADVNKDMKTKYLTYKNAKNQSGENAPITRNNTRDIAEMFGFKDIVLSNGIKLPARVAAGLTMAAVNAWVLTADPEVSKEHFFHELSKSPFDYKQFQDPKVIARGELDETIFPEQLIKKARMIWKHIQTPYDPSTVQMIPDFDYMFKNWQLTNPNLAEYDPRTGKSINGLNKVPQFIMVDEAQDMNPVAYDIFKKQQTLHNNGIQTIVVGDKYQQINAFRGTVDAIDLIGRDVTLPLSKSFRFGEKIAKLANKVLKFLGETDIKGNDDIDTDIVDNDIYNIDYIKDKIDAVLTRTNYGVLQVASHMASTQPWVRVATTKEFKEKYSSIVDTVRWLMRESANSRRPEDPPFKYNRKPNNFYTPLVGLRTWEDLIDRKQNSNDAEVNAIFNIVSKIQRDFEKRSVIDAIDQLEEIVANLRVKTKGFSLPEKLKGQKYLPKEGKLGNGIKYKVDGDMLKVMDTGERFYSTDEQERSGTYNNRLTLRNAGFESRYREIAGQVDKNGKPKMEYWYEKPIEGADKVAGGSDLVEQLTAALSGSDANLIATNTHGAKGLEYDRVVIWDDFFNPDSEKEPEEGQPAPEFPKWQDPEELRIAYVALTRAIKVLYPGSLAFFVDGNFEKTGKEKKAPTNKPDTVTISNSAVSPELTKERAEISAKIAEIETSGEANKFVKEIAALEKELAKVDKKIADERKANSKKPQLMSFAGEPGEFNYPAYNEQMIANIEKSIDEAKRELSRKPADREVAYLPDEELERQISSLEQQIADIQADPDYFKKIDQSNLATAKEALQQLLSGNLDPKLLTYAERWALRSPTGSLGGSAGKNRSMILGLRAKIEELSLRLGESDGTQTENLMLMAFDAADNIDDNQAVTPKPGELGSDENPIKVDLTEEIKSVNKSNQEVVSTVVASILEAMEKGIIPWKKPWTGEGGFLPTSGATGRVYRGLNLLALMAVGMNREYQGTRWYTKNAISKLGGYVNKREDGKDPGVIITFVSTKKYDKEEQVQVPDPDNPDKTKTETRTVTKKFAKMGLDIVYNEDEIQGIELPQLVRKDPPAISEVEGIVLDSYTDKPAIEYIPQDSAYWSPTEDVIRLPLRNQFGSTEEHLDTLFHELTHSTGHQNRLDRKDLLANYGTHKDVRAREELIAEIGSAILAQMMNVNTSIENVAAYVQSWAEWLKGDPNALHEAASLASKAVEHILGGYWASVDGMVDLNEETEAKTVEAIEMPQGEITGEDGTSGGLGKGVNYRIEGESVILMGNTAANKEIIKGTGIVPEGKKRPFSFIFHGRNKYWFVTLSGETGLGDRMRILSELKKNLDGDATITPA